MLTCYEILNYYIYFFSFERDIALFLLIDRDVASLEFSLSMIIYGLQHD
jgi:hypothetical protein